MELDEKQRVLLAIYTEYQKALPDMDSIKPATLGLDFDPFNVAVEKLQNEGFIRDAVIKYGGPSPRPLMVIMAPTKMTRFGIDFVERKLEIKDTDSGSEKVQTVVKKAAEWGWEQIKDIGVRVLAELFKK